MLFTQIQSEHVLIHVYFLPQLLLKLGNSLSCERISYEHASTSLRWNGFLSGDWYVNINRFNVLSAGHRATATVTSRVIVLRDLESCAAIPSSSPETRHVHH